MSNQRLSEYVKNKINGVDCISLAKKYGTPLYVFNQNKIEDICKVMTDTLEKEYGNFAVSYASKAFSCKEIYRVVKQLGLYIDVVSIGELYTALSVGFDAKNVIFHGNNKLINEIEYAVQNGVGLFVIDSYTEAENIQKIAKENDKTVNALIRVNPGVEAHTHHYIQTAKVDSKFGFSIQNGEAKKMIKFVSEQQNINLLGLHCHIGSQIFDNTSFEIAIEKMTDFYKKLQENGYNFSIINIGGGFGIWYAEGDKEFTLSNYADSLKLVSNKLKDCIKEKNLPNLKLIIEPGRSIVGEAGITLYTVGATKDIKDIKNYLAIDGGMFDNPRFALYQAKYTVINVSKIDKELVKKYTIAGKCCESGDIIAEDCMLPDSEVGDVLAVLSTGAYNYSMASNYNRNLVPAVVMVKDGKDRLAVKRQTLEYITENDI